MPMQACKDSINAARYNLNVVLIAMTLGNEAWEESDKKPEW